MAGPILSIAIISNWGQTPISGRSHRHRGTWRCNRCLAPIHRAGVDPAEPSEVDSQLHAELVALAGKPFDLRREEIHLVVEAELALEIHLGAGGVAQIGVEAKGRAVADREAAGTHRERGEELRLPRHSQACSTGISAWHPSILHGRSDPRQRAVMGRIRTVGLVVKRNRPRAARLATRINTKLRRRGIRVLADAEGFLAPFSGLVRHIRTVPIAGTEAAQDATALAKIAAKMGLAAQPAADVATAVDGLMAAEASPIRILICGSLYLAGQVLAQEEGIQAQAN